MKLLLLAVLFVLSFSLSAQAPAPVPLTGEPHHHLVLENEFVRAFYVELAPHDATLLHQHDADYVFAVLGPGDFVNAVAGKPEVHLTLEDATTRFSRGGFAHIARTDAGVPFRNITVELLHPQGALRNLCQKVTDGPVNNCPDSSSPSMKPLFETDEIVVFSGALDAKSKHTEEAPHTAALILALENSPLDVNVGGDVKAQLRSGQVFWLPAGQKHTISSRGGACRFLLVSFKDSAAH
jgi:hypothetical protein